MKLIIHSSVNVVSGRSRFSNLCTILENSLTGKCIHFDIEPSKSMVAIKKQASSVLFDSISRINVVHQTLFLNDKEIDDTTILNRSGIKEGDVLMLKSAITVK